MNNPIQTAGRDAPRVAVQMNVTFSCFVQTPKLIVNTNAFVNQPILFKRINIDSQNRTIGMQAK